MAFSDEVFEEVLRLRHQGIRCVLATLIDLRGSAPQERGAKVLISERGLEAGTIGGGKLEAKVITEAQSLLNRPCDVPLMTHFKWNLQRDVGMSCGGETEVMLEVLEPLNWNIVVMGAGHVSQSVCRILMTMACQVHVVDDRREWLDRLPEGSRLRKIRADFGYKNLDLCMNGISPNSYFLVMTQGHQTDLPVLEWILKGIEAPYVGVLGSRAKSAKLRRELVGLGVDSARVDRLCCPMGLPFGTRDPSEIAVSITAQILQRRDQLSHRQKDPCPDEKSSDNSIPDQRD